MKSVLIIGMSEFGKHLAYRLLELKASVCIYDKDKDLISVLSDDFENAYVADCTKDVVLRDLGVSSFDVCVVSVGKNFQAALEITSKLHEYGAKYIISRGSNDLQCKFLKIAGADETVDPQKDIANKIAVKCTASGLLDVFEVSDEYSVFEIPVQKEWVGKALKDTDIRKKYDLNVIAVKFGKTILIPDANYVFRNEDSLFVFGKSKKAKKIK